MKGNYFRQWFDPFFAFLGQTPGYFWEFCSVRRLVVFFWLVQCQVEGVRGETRVGAGCWRPDLACCSAPRFTSAAIRISRAPWEPRSYLPGRRCTGTRRKKRRRCWPCSTPRGGQGAGGRARCCVSGEGEFPERSQPSQPPSWAEVPSSLPAGQLLSSAAFPLPGALGAVVHVGLS